MGLCDTITISNSVVVMSSKVACQVVLPFLLIGVVGYLMEIEGCLGNGISIRLSEVLRVVRLVHLRLGKRRDHNCLDSCEVDDLNLSS